MNSDKFEPEISDDDTKREVLLGFKTLNHLQEIVLQKRIEDPIDLHMTPASEFVVMKSKCVQPRIDENDTSRKELKKRVCKAYARWMYDAGIPFNVVTQPSLTVYFEAQ